LRSLIVGISSNIQNETLELHTFQEVEHPTVLPNFQDAIGWTLPFMSSCVHHFFKHLLMLDNGKISKKLQEIISSKEKFKQDLNILETVKLIDSIMAFEAKEPV
jgi:hypothetical protein